MHQIKKRQDQKKRDFHFGIFLNGFRWGAKMKQTKTNQ